MVEETLKQINNIANKNDVILSGYIEIGRGTNCLLFAHYCEDTLFYKRFIKVSREILTVRKVSNKNLREVKMLLKKHGYTKIRTKGVFSVYGDMRGLAVKAGFGQWGEDGLIHNEKYDSNFLITAVFFE